MKVKSESEVAQLCLTLRDTMDCSLPGSSVHGIFQARVLEWGATAFSGITNWFTLKKELTGRGSQAVHGTFGTGLTSAAFLAGS